jgi:predicted RNA-binding protein (virulence factor B family)
MTTTKITKRDRFNALLNIPAVQADQGLVDFINHELELLARKNSAEKKPTAAQVANDGIKAAILDGMETDRLYTITELQKSIPACAELSNQKVSALVRQLKDEGAVVKTEDKRKSYFSLA